jgi:hypothetical protein
MYWNQKTAPELCVTTQEAAEYARRANSHEGYRSVFQPRPKPKRAFDP